MYYDSFPRAVSPPLLPEIPNFSRVLSKHRTFTHDDRRINISFSKSILTTMKDWIDRERVTNYDCILNREFFKRANTKKKFDDTYEMSDHVR